MKIPLQFGDDTLEFECFDNALSKRMSAEILQGQTYPVVKGINEIQVVLDIGANIGASALYFSFMYPEAEIFAFEPAKAPYQLLQKNARLDSRIHAHNFGMFSVDRELQLYTGAIDCVTASIGKSAENTTESETIKLRSVRDWLDANSVTTIDLLKIDTEGCELPILEGVSDFIPSIKLLHLEYHSEDDRKEIDRILDETHILAGGNILHLHRGELTYAAKSAFTDPSELYRDEIKVEL